MISRSGDSRLISISLRVYRVLLVSYPQSFRQEYAPHMLQAFGDYTRRVYLQRGWAGMLWWWTLTFFDFANSVLEEHLQRITNMTKEKFIHLGGLALVLGSLVLFFGVKAAGNENSAIGQSSFFANIEGILWVSMPILFATGYAALRSQYREKIGPLGNFALVASVITSLLGFLGMLASFFINSVDIPRESLMLFLFSAMLSMAFFGLDALRLRYLPHWGWGFLLIIAGALPILVLGLQFILQQETWGSTPLDPIFVSMPIVFAMGAFLFGYNMIQTSGETRCQEFPMF